MGKPKKATQDQDRDDLENGEIATDDLGANGTDVQNTTQPSKDRKKKNKKGKQKDEEWDEMDSELQMLPLNANNFIEEDEGDAPVYSKNKKGKNKKEGMSGFALLDDLGDYDDGVGDLSDKQSDDDNEKKEEENVTVQKPKKKEKTKKEKPKKQEDEDFDALLADIENTGKAGKSKKKKNKGDVEEGNEEASASVQEIEKIENKVVSIDDLEDEFEDDKKKRKKNKKKGKEEETQEDKKEDANAEDGEGEEMMMKSAAQKKKEKKEREKQKKMEEKQKQLKKEQVKKEKEEQEGPTMADKGPTLADKGPTLADKGPTLADKGPTMADKGKEETISKSKESEVKEMTEPSPCHEATPEGIEVEGDEVKEKEGKKKKKKKVAEKEKEEKKEEKKPVNKKLAALKEALRIQKEEEELAIKEAERLRLEEDERIRKFEEEHKRKEEAKRLKKLAKKEREAQLKKEGKFLTEKQKQDKRKVEQMLAAMKLSGVEIGPRPESAPTKRGIVYGKKKDPRKMGNKEKSPTTPSEDSPKIELNESQEDTKKEVGVTEVKKAEEIEDVKEEWDAESEDEEKDDASPEKSSTPATVKSETVQRKEEEEEAEDEEEEEEEDEEESSEESEESESESDEDKTPIERGRDKIQKREEKAEKVRTVDHLRAPVVCVLGHVDTGKTKILDKLRRTNVQDGEAGGITQQIGATNVPKDAVMEKTKMVKEFAKQELKLPGLLIIDTPGHESFSNLRLRGSSLCDIAILVIDIMHGLEPQTIESIKLLKDRKTPFLVALNKVDRLYQWKPQPMADVQNTLKKQTPHTKAEFDERVQQVILQLAEEGLNASLFYENKNPREYVSLVPTSAHSGDGMGNLVALVCELCQNLLAKRLMYSTELQATVMEVKAITGMGTTIDVILINGALKEGECIVLAGTEGPIVTQIRGLLMPQPMKELRVKSQYEHHKTVMAAQGVKINAKDMEKCLAGLPLYVAHDNDEKEYYKNEVASVLKDTLESIKVQDRGVFVQASTLGSLEALLEFLRTSKIPYAGINIGPVHKKDIMRASVMLEHDSQYAVILAFDVKVEREAQEMADNLGVRIFTAEIIYHLFDAFTKYREDLKRQKQEEFKHIAVFPCKLRVLPQYVFNSRDPIVMGVIVETGFLKEGTPICVPSKEFVDIGRVASLELNHKQVEIAKQGQEVCIKIIPNPGEAPKMYGRHFEETDLLVSKISRQSIDAVKDYFREEMTKPDWRLMVELKRQFEIL